MGLPAGYNHPINKAKKELIVEGKFLINYIETVLVK